MAVFLSKEAVTGLIDELLTEVELSITFTASTGAVPALKVKVRLDAPRGRVAR
ncbi:hypothetical protein D3C81_2164310 [compost metagenome]